MADDPSPPDEVPTPPVSVLIEKDDDRKYTVRTSDLGYIASQLRGKRSFSVFNSIILPILVVVGTTLVTTAIGSLFQYVSWRNSTKLQKATDQASRANRAYERASIAIGKRYYSTFLYLAAVRDLVNLPPSDSRLYEFNRDLNRRRFDAYYQQLRDWNEAYDQTLTEIDFSMDRPVRIAEVVRRAALTRIECSQTLIEQLKKNNMNAVSLKVQFAALNHCFSLSTVEFTNLKDRALKDSAFTIDENIKADANETLNAANGMANEFRCHALLRIEYFNQLKDNAIFKPIAYLKDRVGRWAGESQSRDFDIDAALRRCKI
jgi:hypothetical protein